MFQTNFNKNSTKGNSELTPTSISMKSCPQTPFKTPLGPQWGHSLFKIANSKCSAIAVCLFFGFVSLSRSSLACCSLGVKSLKSGSFFSYVSKRPAMRVHSVK